MLGIKDGTMSLTLTVRQGNMVLTDNLVSKRETIFLKSGKRRKRCRTGDFKVEFC